MTDVLKHRFVSPRADGADPTQIQPSYWNDGHKFQGGTAGQVLTRDPTDANFGAAWTSLVAPVSPVSTFIASTTTGTVNDWVPGSGLGPAHTLIQWSGAANLTITGLAAGAVGKMVTIVSVSNFVISLPHASTGSVTANRLFNIATSAPMPIAYGGYATYFFNGSTWLMIGHDQGAALTPVFVASDYTATGSMTWTLAAGDVSGMFYQLRGRMLWVGMAVASTTVGGTPNIALVRTIPGGFTAAGQVDGAMAYIDSGTPASGLWRAVSTQLQFYKSLLAPAWTVSTDNTFLSMSGQFGVT